MRAVLDSNVLISAAITQGTTHRIVQDWFERESFELVVCESCSRRWGTVLVEQDRMRRWISVEDARIYVDCLATTADVRDDPPEGPPLTRDPDDDFVVYLAREQEADLIVSGDSDLLEWPEQDPPVVTPARFVQMLEEAG